MAPIIEARSLSHNFGPLNAVDGIDLTVNQGEMFGLVGPDGAGKTTVIRMLCGILLPSAGSATVLGFDLLQQADEIKRHIGYLSQRFSLYGDMTVDENIEFFAEINQVFEYRDRREELLAFTRLTPFRDRLAERLSGGMKQKLALACTLVHTPKVIFLDEPTTGVDPVSRRDFWKILQSLLQQGITIVMSTPYLDEAERCSRVALMNKGKLMRVDPPMAMKDAMRGEVVEIVCDKVRDGYRLLKGRWPGAEVQAFGDRLNVIVEHADKDAAQLRVLLESAGISIASLRTISPSLENVFISMLTHTEGGA
jgi:ABC-2 type transport system ATP-binding protein